MSGLAFVVLAAALSGGMSLVNRYALRGKANAASYALAFHFLAALFYLPFFAAGEFRAPTQPEPWLLALLAALLWTAIAQVGFLSFKHAEVSWRAPLGRTKVIWVLLFAALFLGESLAPLQLAGVLLILLGAAAVSWSAAAPPNGARPPAPAPSAMQRLARSLRHPGVHLTLATALLGGAAYVVDKAASPAFAPATYGFIQYLLPGTFLALLLRSRRARVRELFQTEGKWVAATALLGTLSYYAIITAYQTLDASIVAPLLELSLILSVLGGIILLRERGHLLPKLAGAALTLAGAVLVAL